MRERERKISGKNVVYYVKHMVPFKSDWKYFPFFLCCVLKFILCFYLARCFQPQWCLSVCVGVSSAHIHGSAVPGYFNETCSGGYATSALCPPPYAQGISPKTRILLLPHPPVFSAHHISVAQFPHPLTAWYPQTIITFHTWYFFYPPPSEWNKGRWEGGYMVLAVPVLLPHPQTWNIHLSSWPTPIWHSTFFFFVAIPATFFLFFFFNPCGCCRGCRWSSSFSLPSWRISFFCQDEVIFFY